MRTPGTGKRESTQADGFVNKVDRLAGTGMDRLGQRIPRRRVLELTGSALLSVLGVSVAQRVLPFQAPYEAGATHVRTKCPDWFMCGMWGNMCDCQGCHHGSHNCPGCAVVSGSWCRCCQEPSGCDKKVIYRDCYKGSCSNQQKTACNNCPFCTRNGGTAKVLWDVPSGHTGSDYMCTAAIVMDCAMCNDCP